jgi:Ni,Fe-hydrogenase III small subunit
MIEWLVRGLRHGVVTTRYPRRAEPAPAGYRGRVDVLRADGASPALEEVCPTRAIAVRDGEVSLDRGRCILCGACVARDPERFGFVADYETAVRRPGSTPLADRSGALRRSIHVRHVDAGSDGAEEWEIQALTNPVYDVQRLGIFFTATPRHADVLLVTGGVTPSMREPLLRAYEAMPEPRAVVAVGTDACSGGLAAGTGDVSEGVDTVLPVDVYVPGSPPAPIAILHGLLLAAGVVSREAAA